MSTSGEKAATRRGSSTNNQDDENERKSYVREKNVHHLFELLATKVLEKRPDNVYEFLRETLEKIEKEETRPHKHDPSQILYAPATAGPGDAGGAKPKGQIKMTLAVFGLDNAGKTALISAMGGTIDKDTTPTVGFSPNIFDTELVKLCVFDLGGGRNFRGIWPNYYHDCHGCIYVVDSADTARIEEAAASLQDVGRHKFMAGKPLLVFANKADKPGAMSASAIRQAAKLDESGRQTKFLSSCAISEDANIDEGVEWLMEQIRVNYADLSALVAKQCAEFKDEKKKRMEEQQRRVEAQKKLDSLA